MTIPLPEEPHFLKSHTFRFPLQCTHSFLDFDFNQLSGSLPSELYLLTGLEQLDLNDNQLTGNVDQMGALSNLEFLQLHGM